MRDARGGHAHAQAVEQRARIHELGSLFYEAALRVRALIAALQDERVGAVLLVIDSPGGVCAGLQESIRRG